MKDPTASKRDLRVDYFLSFLSGMMALYTVGMGVSNLTVVSVFMVAVLIGTPFSFFLRKLITGTSLEAIGRYSGAIYAIGSTLIFLSRSQLNAILPEHGFPYQLIMACIMCWIIAIGSFLMWSDEVVLFQAVPAVSLFGMVGLWDTYSGATLIFFVFLLSVVIMLARAHARHMLNLAEASGCEVQKIHNGPWRQMAGPQWGLVAATVVILISVLCAPLIQKSVASFSGQVQLTFPATIAKPTPATQLSMNNTATSVSIGNGPQKPGNRISFRAFFSEPTYYRELPYDIFDGRNWNRGTTALDSKDRVWQDDNILHRSVFSQKLIKDPIQAKFQLYPEAGFYNYLPLPGDTTLVASLQTSRQSYSGTNLKARQKGARYEGICLLPNPQTKIVNASKSLSKMANQVLTQFNSSSRVYQLARSITDKYSSDYDKATAIKDYISSHTTYNLSTEATPRNTDPIDYFLFESKQGYCDLYASSMVMMARAAGIPARYVVGYYPINDEKDDNGLTVIRMSDRHAWAELLFEGVGWVPFDATEGTSEVEGYGRGASGEKFPWYQKTWVKTALSALIIALSFVIVAMGGVTLLRYRSQSRNPIAGVTDINEVNRLVAKSFALFTRDVYRMTGIKKSLEMSPQEYAFACSEKLGSLAPLAQNLSSSFAKVFYSAPVPSQEDLQALSEEMATFKAEVKKQRAEQRWSIWLGTIWNPLKHFGGLLKEIFRLRSEDSRKNV